MAVQPGLCATWSETPKTGFLTTRLILLQDLQVRLDRQEESSNKLRNENGNLNHDLNQLINVISTARTTGNWNVSAAYNTEKDN